MSLCPPGFIEPCLPIVSRMVPSGLQRVYEIKHDGFRFICRRDGEHREGGKGPHSDLSQVVFVPLVCAHCGGPDVSK